MRILRVRVGGARKGKGEEGGNRYHHNLLCVSAGMFATNLIAASVVSC